MRFPAEHVNRISFVGVLIRFESHDAYLFESISCPFTKLVRNHCVYVNVKDDVCFWQFEKDVKELMKMLIILW